MKKNFKFKFIICLIVGIFIFFGLYFILINQFSSEIYCKFETQSSIFCPDLVQVDNFKQVKKLQGNFEFLFSNLTLIRGSNYPGRLYFKIENPSSTGFNFQGGNLNESTLFRVKINSGKIEEGFYDNFGENKINIYSPQIFVSSGESNEYLLEVYARPRVPLGKYYANFSINFTNQTYSEVVIINVE